MDADEEVRESYEHNVEYREWVGDTSDFISIAKEMNEALALLKQQIETTEGEWLTGLRTEVASNGPLSRSAEMDLVRFEKGFSAECTVITRHNATLVGPTEQVISKVRPSDVVSCSLTHPSYFGLDTQKPKGRIELRFRTGSVTNIWSIRLMVEGTDKAWVLATLAALKQPVEVGTQPWWRFLRRLWFSNAIGALISVGMALVVLLTFDDEWGKQNPLSFMILLVAAPWALGVATHVAAKTYLTPFELLERGTAGQASRRLKACGIVSSAVLAILGIILTFI